MSTTIIKVLIVSSNPSFRRRIIEILIKSPFIEVVGSADSTEEVLPKIEELNPDVVILDLLCSFLEPLIILHEIMTTYPRPVLVSSNLSNRRNLLLASLELGAVGMVPHPIDKNFRAHSQVIKIVKEVANLNFNQTQPEPPQFEAEKEKTEDVSSAKEEGCPINLVIIGCSLGGPQALKTLIPPIPSSFPAGIVIVQHIPKTYTKSLAEKLDSISNLKVMEATEGSQPKPGKALIAPAGYHLLFARRDDGQVYITLDSTRKHALHIPSVDVTMISAARTYKDKCLGVILTGMGSDGVEGMIEIKKFNGLTLAESEETCAVFGMAKEAINAGVVDEVLPLYKIGARLLEIVKQKDESFLYWKKIMQEEQQEEWEDDFFDEFDEKIKASGC